MTEGTLRTVSRVAAVVGLVVAATLYTEVVATIVTLCVAIVGIALLLAIVEIAVALVISGCGKVTKWFKSRGSRGNQEPALLEMPAAEPVAEPVAEPAEEPVAEPAEEPVIKEGDEVTLMAAMA